jgi:DNA-binding NarL/FixJ family response regulator
MGETVRLSDASMQAAAALAVFDTAGLEELVARVTLAAAGEIAIEHEPVAAIKSRQRVLAEVLITTGKNIEVLRRLRERKVRDEWVR